MGKEQMGGQAGELRLELEYRVASHVTLPHGGDIGDDDDEHCVVNANDVITRYSSTEHNEHYIRSR
jgi:hypothetical protein